MARSLGSAGSQSMVSGGAPPGVAARRFAVLNARSKMTAPFAPASPGAGRNLALYLSVVPRSLALARARAAAVAAGSASSPRGASAAVSVDSASNNPANDGGKYRSGGAPVTPCQTASTPVPSLDAGAEGGRVRAVVVASSRARRVGGGGGGVASEDTCARAGAGRQGRAAGRDRAIEKNDGEKWGVDQSDAPFFCFETIAPPMGAPLVLTDTVLGDFKPTRVFKVCGGEREREGGGGGGVFFVLVGQRLRSPPTTLPHRPTPPPSSTRSPSTAPTPCSSRARKMMRSGWWTRPQASSARACRAPSTAWPT